MLDESKRVYLYIYFDVWVYGCLLRLSSNFTGAFDEIYKFLIDAE